MKSNKIHYIQYIVKLVFLLAFIIPGNISFSQEARFIQISPGIQIAAERDYGYSPLIYSGMQSFASLAYNTSGPEKSDCIVLSYTSGGLKNKYDKKMKVYTGNIQTFKFYHRQKDVSKGLHWGWSNNNEFSIRDNEVADNFNFRSDYFTSFGGALRYRLPLKILEKNLLFETLAHIQLIGFKINSSYVESGIDGYDGETKSPISALIKSADLFYPGNSMNIGVWPGLNYELTTGNMLSLNYRYDYINLKGAHMSEKSRGKWFISLFFKI